MRIIAFYSFKGGVGRTTALLNVAYCLAERGRKVVVADWDLHAPGLSLMELMRGDADTPPTAGVLDWLVDIKQLPADEAGSRTSIADIVVCPRLVKDAQSEQRQVDDPEQPRMRGELLFLPAGDLSQGAERFAERVKEAGLHDLQRFLRDVDPDDKRFVFKVFCEELRETRLPWSQPASQGEPDYLLVDCRTGLTEVGDLLLGEATDFNVLVYAHDPQNLKGLEIALNVRPRTPWQLQNNTLLLWTLEPIGQEALKLQVRQRKRELVQAVCQQDSLGMKEAFPEEFEVPYHPELALTNEPIVHRYFSSDLARVFRKATDRLEEKTHWKDTVIREMGRDWRQAGQTQGPLKAAAELETVLADEEENERLYRGALAQLALAREFTPLLFNPPTFDFAGCRLADLCDDWPDDLTEDDRNLLANLLAWSISLATNSKRDVLRSQLAKLKPAARQELTGVVHEERQKFVTMSGLYLWNIVTYAMMAAWEWWLFVGSEESRQAAAAEIVRPLLDGQPIERLPTSRSPWFPLLAARVIGRALSPRKQEADEGKDYPLLRDWLKTCGVDLPHTLMQLTEQACSRGEEAEAYEAITPYAWSEVGQALNQEALRRKTDEGRVDWLDHAIEALEKAAALRADDPTTLFSLGLALHERGRVTEAEHEKRDWFDRAIAVFEKSLARRPDDAGTLHNLGSALGERGVATQGEEEKRQWFDRAIAAFEKSLARRPDDAATLHNVGRALAARGRATEAEEERGQWFDRAIAALEKSLARRPDDAETLHNLGLALDARGRATEATEAKRQWFDHAIAAYEQSLARRPDDAATLHNLGYTLAARGRATEGEEAKRQWFDRAIAACEKSLARRPNDARTLHNFGSVLADRGRATEGEEAQRQWFDRAIAAYEQSLARQPDDADTLHNLGSALGVRGRATEGEEAKRQWFDRAIAAYEQSLARRPDDADTLDNLTSSLLLRWRIAEDPDDRARLLAEAERHILRARAIDPQKAQYNYCCVLSLKGEREACLAELKTLLETRPERKKDVAEDPDFGPLSGLPEFQRLIEPYTWQPDPAR